MPLTYHTTCGIAIVQMTIMSLYPAAALTAAAESSGKEIPGKPAVKREAAVLAIESLEVDPAQPSTDSLCSLRVRLRNKGSQPAMYFSFAVRINGQDVPTYKNHVYAQAIASDTLGEIQLFSFGVTESGRPAPKDGQLRVEVILREAHWVDVKREGNATEYQRRGSVPGLPIAFERTIPLGAVNH